jgi:hypothetical protein
LRKTLNVKIMKMKAKKTAVGMFLSRETLLQKKRALSKQRKLF